MCLVAIAWQIHHRYDLIIAANRDEFYQRPTRAAHWWPDAPTVYGGRDERAGGAWCAADTAARLAAVTNVRDTGTPSGQRTRGDLVYAALTQAATFADFAARTASERPMYGPFNLLLADHDNMQFISNRGARRDVTLAPGVHAVSNGHWGEHWPKTDHAQHELHKLVETDNVSAQDLFALLAESDRAATDSLPATGVGPNTEQLLSSLFVHSPAYGTRASSVILRDRNGRIDFHERAFDRNARIIHDQHAHWSYT